MLRFFIPFYLEIHLNRDEYKEFVEEEKEGIDAREPHCARPQVDEYFMNRATEVVYYNELPLEQKMLW